MHYFSRQGKEELLMCVLPSVYGAPLKTLLYGRVCYDTCKCESEAGEGGVSSL